LKWGHLCPINKFFHFFQIFFVGHNLDFFLRYFLNIFFSTTAMYHEWLDQLEWCRCHRIFIQIQICTETCS
jgi:hypothetical protein